MIEVQHLTKRYGGFTAVNDVSFRVEKGEILGFLGPNGAGKTTLSNLVARFYDPGAGRVLLDGRDLRDYDVPLPWANGTPAEALVPALG